MHGRSVRGDLLADTVRARGRGTAYRSAGRGDEPAGHHWHGGSPGLLRPAEPTRRGGRVCARRPRPVPTRPTTGWLPRARSPEPCPPSVGALRRTRSPRRPGRSTRVTEAGDAAPADGRRGTAREHATLAQACGSIDSSTRDRGAGPSVAAAVGPSAQKPGQPRPVRFGLGQRADSNRVTWRGRGAIRRAYSTGESRSATLRRWRGSCRRHHTSTHRRAGPLALNDRPVPSRSGTARQPQDIANAGHRTGGGLLTLGRTRARE